MFQSNAERISFGVLLVTVAGLVGRAIVRFFLFLGDAIFKVFWRRNDQFVRSQQADTFRAQMNELVGLPTAINELNTTTARQTGLLERILQQQEDHGLDIAELRTAMSFVAPGAIRLRRQLARRAGDPRPTDAALLHAIDPSSPPDQSEDVAGHDDPI